MDAKVTLLALLLVACEGGNSDTPAASANPLSNSWKAQAEPGDRLEDCFLKVALPNPLDPVVYQLVIRKVWEERSRAGVPVYFTYNSDNVLFILLAKECDQSLAFAQNMEIHLRESTGIQNLSVSRVSSAEAATLLAQMN
jgi:hypothetical protein